jgi:hypothetical protein
VHGVSDVRYNLGGVCSTFTASIGIDNEVAPNGSVLFQVWTDGVKRYDSGPVTGTMSAIPVSVDVTGKMQLQLVVDDAGNGLNSAHADWAAAAVTCGTTSGPTVTTVSPYEGSTSVPVSTAVTATFSRSMNQTTISGTTFTLAPQGGATSVAATVSYNATNLTATLQPSAPLQAGVIYVATVKGGSAGVKDSNGNVMAADKIWSFTTASAPGSGTRYLSDLPWIGTPTNGWGPVEKDMSNGEQPAGDGRPLSIRGVTFAKGLGAHGPSEIRYSLDGTCSTFAAKVGIDDEVAPNGAVQFRVSGGGSILYDSDPVNGLLAAAAVSVPVSGLNELVLTIADTGSGFANAHADWADAKLLCGSTTNTPPVPTITAPASNQLFKVGDVISYSGSATDTQDGSIPASGLSWSIILHHCPGGACHSHPFTTGIGFSGTFTAPDHGDESYFEIKLTATDSGGLTASASTTIQPQTVKLALQTSPSGLQVIYGGEAGTSPMTRTTIVGSSHTISVPSPQGQNTFASWSDGGARQHDVVVGPADVVYTATFTPGEGGAPTVTSTVPSSAATGVALTAAPITGTFSTAMDASSITASTFTLVVSSTGTSVPAAVTYDGTSKTATLTPSAPLQPAVTYTATIKGGAAGVKDTGGTSMVADKVWSFTTRSGPPSGTPYVSDLTWTGTPINGWGPVEKDMSNGEKPAGDGSQISIRGIKYTKGLGTHAASEVRYALAGGCSTFQAVVGIDDEVTRNNSKNGSVTFEVWTDGTKLYDSGLTTGADAGKTVNVNISGKNELRLVVTDGGNNANNDHADWADAKVTCQ